MDPQGDSPETLRTLPLIPLRDLLVFPATLFGAWIGARTYHALSDQNFRDVVLGLLFVSGAGLVWSSLGVR